MAPSVVVEVFPFLTHTVGAGIHLAEASNTLIRNVEFEIPYFKKLAEKTQQQLADQEHKHGEYMRNAEAATKEYDQVSLELKTHSKDTESAMVAVLL